MTTKLEEMKLEYKNFESAIVNISDIIQADVDRNEGDPRSVSDMKYNRRVENQRTYLIDSLAALKTNIEALELAETLKFTPSPLEEKIWNAFLTLSIDDKLNFIASKILFK